MQTLNNIYLLGHVGAKAETIVFEKNKMITKISLATNNLVGDKEVTQWHKLVFKGKAAEVVSLIDKGDKLSIVGRLVYKNWDDTNGRKHNTAEIEVKEFSVIEGKIASLSQPQEPQQLQRLQPQTQQVQPRSQQRYNTQPQPQTQQVQPRSQQRYNTQPQPQTQQVQPRSQQGYNTQPQPHTQQVQPRSQQGYNTQPQVHTQQVQPRSQQGYNTQPQVHTQQVQPSSQQEYYDEGYYDEGIHNQNNEYYGDNAFLSNQPKSAPAVKQSYSAESQKIKMTYSI